MRIIKFRAWDTTRKKMWSAEEMGADQEALLPDGRGFANISSDNTRLSQIHSHLLPLQYTGLRDSKGKEIYEGDIVKATFNSSIHKVEWRNDQCQWSIGGFGMWEVIGDIYSNPELLT